jgi:GT2 family glycosyltransferase
MEPDVSISVVSHGQGSLLANLLHSISRHCRCNLEVLITINVPEPAPSLIDFPFPVRLINNTTPRGFGANHNNALAQAKGEYFCLLNPDIQLTCDPFPELIGQLANYEHPGVIAPRVVTPDGALEDSARPFPTPMSILAKAFGYNPDRDWLNNRLGKKTLEVDWVAGMFMLFPRTVFQCVGGFDEGYFLYYEDVDLCSRLNNTRHSVLYAPHISVVHSAQRESHRNPKFMRWHATSMMRFFVLHFLRNLCKRAKP